MFLVSYKKALKKMPHYNKTKSAGNQSSTTIGNSNFSEDQPIPSVEEGGELELRFLPSTYFECQKGISEWVECAESFSPSSKLQFQQWAKGTEVCLAQAELQQQSYLKVQNHIRETTMQKNKSRKVIQKGDEITVKAARLRKKEKEQRNNAATIQKAQRNIQIAINKAKTSLNRRGIDARKAEKARRKQVKEIEAIEGIVSVELLLAIPDSENILVPRIFHCTLLLTSCKLY